MNIAATIFVSLLAIVEAKETLPKLPTLPALPTLPTALPTISLPNITLWGANDCPASNKIYNRTVDFFSGNFGDLIDREGPIAHLINEIFDEVMTNFEEKFQANRGEQNFTLCYNNPPGEAFKHFRNCYLDIYLPLCAIQVPDSDWSFICESQNYCLGCRYGYETCADGSSGTETYLTWIDGLMSGGKYAACDMNNLPYYNKINDTIKREGCMNDDTYKCIEGIQEYTMSIPKVSECSKMGDKIECFFNNLPSSTCSGTRSIIKTFFQGVVSFTPCDGQIPSIAGAFGLLPDLGLITCLATLALIIHDRFNF